MWNDKTRFQKIDRIRHSYHVGQVTDNTRCYIVKTFKSTSVWEGKTNIHEMWPLRKWLITCLFTYNSYSKYVGSIPIQIEADI